MNILFHCWEYPPRGSGIGRYIYHMSSALRKAGCFTVIVTSHGSEGPSEISFENGVIYKCYRCEEIEQNRITELVLDRAGKHRIDWIEGVDHLGESAQLLTVKNRPPVVIKAHYNDAVLVARYAQAHYFWQKLLIDIACWRDRRRIERERSSLALADLLIAPSNRFLLEMKKQGIPVANRQAVIPNPITALNQETSKEAEIPTLLLVGRIDIGKGVEYLPALVEGLRRKFSDLVVEIAGGDSYARFLGSTRDWLSRLMGSDRGRIKFLGELDSTALDEAYSRAWVVIVPSNWDTFPTVVLEAMIRGKAIVASPHGGMPEMLAETSCTIADPAGQSFTRAIEFFLADRKLRQAAGKSAQKRACTLYSPDNIAGIYLQLLHDNR